MFRLKTQPVVTRSHLRWMTLDVQRANPHYFDGVNSAFHLWCNGQWMGYSQDSRLPAEFDLSAVLRPGQNRGGNGVTLVRRKLSGRSGHVADEWHFP